MQKRGYIFWLFTAGLLIASGCASTNVNPLQPRPNTGYIDLYSPTDGELCWDVSESHGSDTHFRTVFSDVKPVEDDLLRLAFSPGPHHLRVTFLNRVVKRPAFITCEIKNGKITPIVISLTAAGQTTVLSKQVTIGGTPAGLGGRRTKINSDETVMYEISAEADAAVPYQPKNHTHYTH